MNANDQLRRLVPLMDKLGEQLEKALLSPEGISLIEKDLMKDSLKKMYEAVDALEVVSGAGVSTGHQQEGLTQPATIVNPRQENVTASVLSTMREFASQQEVRPAETTPLPVVIQEVSRHEENETPVHHTLSAGSEPALASATGDLPVAEEMRKVEPPVQEVDSFIGSVEAVNIAAASPKSPVEEKVVVTRAKHLYAAAQFEEQNTIAAKYTAPETLGEKVIRDAAPRRLSDQLQATPLADLKTSIGINERFAFINELFGGDQQLYFQSLEQIHLFGTYEEAATFLKEDLTPRLDWSAKPERARQFDELVKRRFHA